MNTIWQNTLHHVHHIKRPRNINVQEMNNLHRPCDDNSKIFVPQESDHFYLSSFRCRHCLQLHRHGGYQWFSADMPRENHCHKEKPP